MSKLSQTNPAGASPSSKTRPASVDLTDHAGAIHQADRFRSDSGKKVFQSGIWKSSAHEFRNIRVIASCGVLAALGVVLKYVASIDIGQFIRIGISGVPDLITATMFGPVVGGVFGAALDILKYIISPSGPYFPGFTLNEALTALIFGLFLYKKKVTVKRVLAAEIFTKVFVGMILTALWLSILYGQAFPVIFTTRIVSCLVMIPIDTAITFAILKVVRRVWHREEN